LLKLPKVSSFNFYTLSKGSSFTEALLDCKNLGLSASSLKWTLEESIAKGDVDFPKKENAGLNSSSGYKILILGISRVSSFAFDLFTILDVLSSLLALEKGL